MKKFAFLIAAAIMFGFTSCSEEDCDHDFNTTETASLDVVGSWYEEAENEELRLNENGTFYDKYCNTVRSAETEGRWEYDKANGKLTQSYSFMGQMQFADWTVKELKELSLTIYSTTVASHTLEKIVETYTLEVGETAEILFSQVYPSYTVKSYESKNVRLASVSSEGKIKAEGEKGTTYIKVATDKGNAWVKVVVGDDCLDLWYDYVSLINADYTTLKNVLGIPSINGDDGYSYGYVLSDLNDIVKELDVFLNTTTGLVEEMALVLKEGAPESQIVSYMNSHYYKKTEDESLIFYSSVESLENSKAIIAYDKIKKIVRFYETVAFLNPPVVDLWPDFTTLFGSDATMVNSTLKEQGCLYLMSDYSYSKNGADYYSITDNKHIQMAAFVFNPDDKMSEYWMYMQTDDYDNVCNDVYVYLMEKYTEAEDEAASGTFVFYNDDKSVKITLDLKMQAVIYNCVNMKQHETPNTDTDLLSNYWEGLGKTSTQLESLFGSPFTVLDDGTYCYFFTHSVVSMGMYEFDTTTGKTGLVYLSLTETTTASQVVEYLNSKYTVWEKGTLEDGSKYTWIDGSTLEESTMGITYLPENNVVIYQALNTGSSGSKRFLSDKKIEDTKAKVRRISKK